MFEPFNEYRDKSDREKELYKSKVFLIIIVIAFIGAIACGVIA
jgi:hypothetical protein